MKLQFPIHTKPNHPDCHKFPDTKMFITWYIPIGWKILDIADR